MPSLTDNLIATAISIATGWLLAWLVGKVVSVFWPSAEPWVFYGLGGMWTLVAVLRIIRAPKTVSVR
jgi:hypothetical protein